MVLLMLLPLSLSLSMLVIAYVVSSSLFFFPAFEKALCFFARNCSHRAFCHLYALCKPPPRSPQLYTATPTNFLTCIRPPHRNHFSLSLPHTPHTPLPPPSCLPPLHPRPVFFSVSVYYCRRESFPEEHRRSAISGGRAPDATGW